MSKFLRAGGVAAGLSLVVAFAANGTAPPEDVVLEGSVIAEAAVTAVQHPTGGIVAEVKRRIGDHVKSGELLARLDDRAIRTDLVQSETGLDELVVRRARLEAERAGRADLELPATLGERLAESNVATAIAQERRILVQRAESRRTEQDLQKFRIRLIDDEVVGLKAQERAKAAERDLVVRELEGVRKLRDQNLVPLQRLISLERDAVRLDGELNGWLPISMAQAKSRIADSELQLIRSERDRMRDLGNEIGDVEHRISDLVRRKVDIEAELARAQIVAPRDGIVLSSSVAVPGSAIGAGKDIMVIAPTDQKPSIEARLDAGAARLLRVGQEARLAVLSGGAQEKEITARLAKIVRTRADADSVTDDDVTLRFVLPTDAPATLSTMPPGTSVRVSIGATHARSRLLDLVGVVKKPLDRIQLSLL